MLEPETELLDEDAGEPEPKMARKNEGTISASGTAVTVQDTLREFIVSCTKLKEESAKYDAARKQRNQAREQLKNTILPQLQNSPDQVVAAQLQPSAQGAKPQYMTLCKTQPSLSLSDKSLQACVGGLDPSNVKAVISSLDPNDMVPIRKIITDAILLQLTRPGKTQVKLLKRVPKSARIVQLPALDAEQQQWVDACVQSLPPISTLRKQERQLNAQLQECLPGAQEAGFKKPIVINLGEDQGVCRMVLRYKPEPGVKPKLNRDLLLQFLDKMQSTRLEQLVSSASANADELAAISQRIMPALVRAVRDWQAQHRQPATGKLLLE
jgi:hypothetical protein